MVWNTETVSRLGGVFNSRAATVAGPSEWKKPIWLGEWLESMATSSFRKAATPSVAMKTRHSN